MPVTARLSRRFYDAIGDDAANDLVDWMNAVDLTYRTELLQQNEANFTRFVALLDARFAAQDTKFDARFAAIDKRFAALDQRFAAIDERFDAIDRRFAAIDERFEAIDERFGAIDQRFDAIDQRFAAIDQRLVAIDQRFPALEHVIDLKLDTRFAAFEAKMLKWMFVFWATTLATLIAVK